MNSESDEALAEKAPRANPVSGELAVLLDFDGTLTVLDVGQLVMHEFAEPGWHSSGGVKDASFREHLERECETLPSNRADEIERFAIQRAEARAGAVELVQYCVDNSIPVEIVSGGLSNYIEPLLKHFGIPAIPISSLTADFSQGTRAVTTYPDGVVMCDDAGACKCARVRLHKAAGRTVIYAGDGTSDFCVAREADMLFARRTLADYCRERDIPFTPFDSLQPVLDAVQSQYPAD
jgi:2-hydroxy-3-keto-5-methylthiopentenyl-1-phosphate phosphatase